MKRRSIREHLFRALFRREFHPKKEIGEQGQFYFDFQFPEDLIDKKEENEEGIEQPEFEPIDKPSKKDVTMILERLEQVMEHLPDINRILDESSDKWTPSRMAKVDLTILRLAMYEIMFDAEIPVSVAINEAVELAKKYGEDGSPAFVNGVLAKCVKTPEVKEHMEKKGEHE